MLADEPVGLVIALYGNDDLFQQGGVFKAVSVA
jgi:hypothetical protein